MKVHLVSHRLGNHYRQMHKKGDTQGQYYLRQETPIVLWLATP